MISRFNWMRGLQSCRIIHDHLSKKKGFLNFLFKLALFDGGDSQIFDHVFLYSQCDFDGSFTVSCVCVWVSRLLTSRERERE